MNRHPASYWILAIIGLATGIAWWIGHTQDDAFITFRYSQHLAQGLGPVWNPGEAVEGYSNFLWMLLMAVPLWFGLDPVTPSWLMGVTCLAANLWLSYQLFRRFLPHQSSAIRIFLLLVSNFSLLAFGTSGLETSMNALIWTTVLLQTMRLLQANPAQFAPHNWTYLGLLYAVALLSRPDAIILIAVGFAFISLHIWQSKAHNVRHIAQLLLAFSLPILGWLIWKWNFYGALLPNTFYAKGKAFLLADGLQYLGLFGLSYLLVIPAIAIMVRLRQVLAGMTPWLAFGWALTSSWLLYLFAIGGDFMEFRLLVPILPALYLGIGHFLYVTLSDQWWRHAIWGLLLLANVAHGPTFGNWYSSWPMMPIIATRSTEKAGFMSYAAQGQAIRQRIGQAAHLRMAIGGAGAFPYYARYPFTDLFGLTDPITAQTGIQVDWAPGHIKLATLSHLNAEGVNLIILRCDPISKPYPSTILDGSQIILQAMLDHEPNKWNLAQLHFLQIPLNHQFYLSCIYLQAHPRLDTLIQTGEIQEITQRL